MRLDKRHRVIADVSADSLGGRKIFFLPLFHDFFIKIVPFLAHFLVSVFNLLLNPSKVTESIVLNASVRHVDKLVDYCIANRYAVFILQLLLQILQSNQLLR